MTVDRDGVLRHLSQWSSVRVGVEAYIEPATNVTPTTMVLVAHDGEWTRRAVRDEAQAAELAGQLRLPVFKVQLTGYPPAMRAYNERKAAERRAEERRAR